MALSYEFEEEPASKPFTQVEIEDESSGGGQVARVFDLDNGPGAYVGDGNHHADYLIIRDAAHLFEIAELFTAAGEELARREEAKD